MQIECYKYVDMNHGRTSREDRNTERSAGWILQVQKLELDFFKKTGRPKKTWSELVLNDKRKLGMACADPLDRS